MSVRGPPDRPRRPPGAGAHAPRPARPRRSSVRRRPGVPAFRLRAVRTRTPRGRWLRREPGVPYVPGSRPAAPICCGGSEGRVAGAARPVRVPVRGPVRPRAQSRAAAARDGAPEPPQAHRLRDRVGRIASGRGAPERPRGPHRRLSSTDVWRARERSPARTRRSSAGLPTAVGRAGNARNARPHAAPWARSTARTPGCARRTRPGRPRRASAAPDSEVPGGRARIGVGREGPAKPLGYRVASARNGWRTRGSATRAVQVMGWKTCRARARASAVG